LLAWIVFVRRRMVVGFLPFFIGDDGVFLKERKERMMVLLISRNEREC